MINRTLTSGDRHTSGAGTSYPEALAEALTDLTGDLFAQLPSVAAAGTP